MSSSAVISAAREAATIGVLIRPAIGFVLSNAFLLAMLLALTSA